MTLIGAETGYEFRSWVESWCELCCDTGQVGWRWGSKLLINFDFEIGAQLHVSIFEVRNGSEGGDQV